MEPSYRHVIGILFVGSLVLALAVLWAVLWTVVFAVSVAAVLLPVRHWLADRGASPRLASLGATLTAFLVGAALVVPLIIVIYQRRTHLIGEFYRIPDVVFIDVAGSSFTVETRPYLDAVNAFLNDLAVQIASALPSIALKLFVFTLLVYGILRRPDMVHTAVYGLVPPEFRDDVERLHERTMSTLNGIYVLQLATALTTLVLAFFVFMLLGYSAPVALAVIAGILQFAPLIGPSILVLVLAAADVMTGLTGRAAAVLVLGLLVVALLPDLLIRTTLSDRVGRIAAAPYFIGFVGGVFTIGPVGLIVGPVVAALVLETTLMMTEETEALDWNR